MASEIIKLIPMGISAVAACISVAFAYKSKVSQTKLIENKADIETLNELIEQLKIANGIELHLDDFSDDEFASGSNLNEVPAKIAKLIQNSNIAPQIMKDEWVLPITNLKNKINQLCLIRKSLF
jgi:hypothetical protein